MYILKKEKGFTLMELLVVISIIGILMGIGLVSFQGAKKSSRDGKRKADLEQIRSALEIYRTDCKTYPQTSAVNQGSSLIGAGICAGNTYMAEVPSDPGSCSYRYSFVTANSYILCASLEIGATAAVTGCGSCGSGCTCSYKTVNP